MRNHKYCQIYIIPYDMLPSKVNLAIHISGNYLPVSMAKCSMHVLTEKAEFVALNISY